MANPEYLKILIHGVKWWNKWRQENPGIYIDLSETILRYGLFNGANLSDVNLKDAHLGGAYLEGVNLIGADLSGTNLQGAHLSRAKLNDVYLTYSILSEADLSFADLTGAGLAFADLSKADLNETNLTKAFLNGTNFGDVNLSKVKGLELVKHGGPSTIGIDTIYKSGGNIPELFLRGCGIPDEFITFARSLFEGGQSIRFYSCFISYSSKNQDFADRLYTDLQDKGVRCWFAPEDLKIGDKIRDLIDESIRLRDKLLLILSEHSIASDWVEHEVESALEEEHQRGRTILFPIRIDDAVMDSGKAWAALIRRTRHIGDFRKWKNHDSYQKAFDRLLRDLKANL